MGVDNMQNLPLEMKIGLREFGIQEARLAKFNMRTRVMKDLRLCGEQFARLYECLATAYDSDAAVPEEHLPTDGSRDCLFVTLGGFIPFFDRFVETPDVALGALDRHLRG
jgi:hypothetical protein